VGTCDALKSRDANAFQLCEARVSEGDHLSDLDIGSERLDYTDLKKGPQKVQASQASDQTLDPQEVYGRVLDVVESEEASRIRAYSKISGKTPSFPSQWLQILKDKGQIQVPFIFDDLDATTDGDEKLFQACLKEVTTLRRKFQKQGLKETSPEHQKAMADALFDFLREEKNKGGLGITFESSGQRPTRMIGQVYTDGKATCLEFVYLMSALGRMAHLPWKPIEVFRNSDGLVVQHVKIALSQGEEKNRKTWFYDISESKVNEDAGEIWSPLSELELLAYFYNSQAISGAVGDMGAHYEQALRYAPTQYMVLTNYAEWQLAQGSPKDALKALEKAKGANSFYPYVFTGLKKVYENLGEKKKAMQAKQEADRLFQSLDPKK